MGGSRISRSRIGLPDPFFSLLCRTPFGFTDGRWRGQILCDRLALDLLGELKMRAVSGVVGLGAMASGTATAAHGTGDGTRLEVAESGQPLEQRGSVVHQSR